MCDTSSLERTRKETYILDIYESFKRKDLISGSAISAFIQQIQNIYHYFEPSHYKGKLIICTSFAESLVSRDTPEIIYDKNILTNKTSKTIVVQVLPSASELYLWNNIDTLTLLKAEEILFYYFENDNESFIINSKKIEIKKTFPCSSIYSPDYYFLNLALDDYRIKKVLNSSCEHFIECWADKEKRFLFKNKPESTMQVSLKEHLISAMRGVDIDREHNLNASKPVDVFVDWRSSNRRALIEIKWLGESLSSDCSKISTKYTNSRATDGAIQVKEYLDLSERDAPNYIVKGYLVVIDGRRRNLVVGQKDISEADGLYYQDKELQFDAEHDYAKKIYNFEKPIRMFAKPICH